MVIGSLADAVKEVIEIAPDQLEPPPDMGSHWKKDYILGVGQYQEEFIMLLDIKKLFSMTELTTLEKTDQAHVEEFAGVEQLDLSFNEAVGA